MTATPCRPESAPWGIEPRTYAFRGPSIVAPTSANSPLTSRNALGERPSMRQRSERCVHWTKAEPVSVARHRAGVRREGGRVSLIMVTPHDDLFSIPSVWAQLGLVAPAHWAGFEGGGPGSASSSTPDRCRRRPSLEAIRWAAARPHHGSDCDHETRSSQSPTVATVSTFGSTQPSLNPA